MVEGLPAAHNVIGTCISARLQMPTKAAVPDILRAVVIHIAIRPENVQPRNICTLPVKPCLRKKLPPGILIARKDMRISPDGPREIGDAELPQPVLIHHSVVCFFGNNHNKREHTRRILQCMQDRCKLLLFQNAPAADALNPVDDTDVIHNTLIKSRIAEKYSTRILYGMLTLRLCIAIAYLQPHTVRIPVFQRAL